MTVRLGFIGTGNIAKDHMEELAKTDAAMIAFSDIREEAAAEAAKTHDGKAFTDHRKMLDEVEMDAVYICVPPNAHGDIELDVLQKGLHLFVEKPVNIDVKKALEVADAIDKAGVLSASGYVLRHYPFYDQLKTVLEGVTVRQVVVTRWGRTPSKNPWWVDMSVSGGQTVEQVTHQVDTIRALLGEIVRVSAVYTYGLPEGAGDIPSHYNILMELEDGTGVTVSTNCAAPVGKNDMTLITPEAQLDVDYEKGVTVLPEGAIEVPPIKKPPWIDQAFVDAVATGDRSLIRSDYRDAVRSLAVTIACNLSAAEHRMVDVAEVM